VTNTYTNQPGVRTVDTVRFLIDDRDCSTDSSAKLSDEEIEYLVDSNSHVLLAAAAAADAIAASYAADPTDKQVGDLRVSYGGGQPGSYQALAKQLRRQAARKASVGMYAGGISVSDKDTAAGDTDRVQPVFARGMNDHTGGVDERLIDY